MTAGDGNRTHVSSLEGWCSTIELHPQGISEVFQKCFEKHNAQSRNRTSDTRIFSPLLYQLSYLGITTCNTNNFTRFLPSCQDKFSKLCQKNKILSKIFKTYHMPGQNLHTLNIWNFTFSHYNICRIVPPSYTHYQQLYCNKPEQQFQIHVQNRTLLLHLCSNRSANL